MAGNWSEGIIANVTPRKAIHVFELAEAAYERYSTRTNVAFASYPYMLYNTGKNFNLTDYPKADPAHWPPNQSPDNEFRNNHITQLRTTLTTNQDVTRFIKGGGTELYQSAWPDMYTSIEDLLIDALGSSGWMDPALTAGVINVRKPHIAQLRRVAEKLHTIKAAFVLVESRHKSFDSRSDPWYDTIPEAVDAIWTGFDAATWGAWSEDHSTLDANSYIAISGGKYSGWMSATELRVTFNLEIYISGMGWTGYTSAILYGFPLREGLEGGQYNGDFGIFFTCSTTGESGNAVYDDGVVIDSDITSYCGSGHDEEIFIITGDFSETKVKALLNDNANNYLGSQRSETPNWGASYSNVWIEVIPDWKYHVT